MIDFTLINEETIKRLRKKRWVRLPKKKVNIPRDMRWNMRFFNSQLLKGLLAGDTVDEIADRIYPEIMDKTDLFGHTIPEINNIIRRNKQSAIRNARTMVTGAENAGRLDSYRSLSEQGVVQKKAWLATPDDRTRETHIDIDGEEQDIEQPFSNGCMYPGDASAPPDEVWQCRCSMSTHIVGFRRPDGSISRVKGGRDKTTHQPQMAAERKKRGR